VTYIDEEEAYVLVHVVCYFNLNFAIHTAVNRSIA